MRLRDIRRITVSGKRVLVRVDYNIETDRRGRLRDLTRITTTVPMIRWLVRRRAIVLLVSHRGRPTGRSPRWSLRPCVGPLSRALKHPVQFISSGVDDPATTQAFNRLKPGGVALLENIRFEPGEEKNDPRLARRLAGFCDLAVNEAFADSHRAHASIVGLARYRPTYAGLRLQQENTYLSQLTDNPPRPYLAILGGAKISTKLGLVRRLLKRADAILLGGALANTVLQAEGLAIGSSVSEPGMLRAARGLSVQNPRLKIPLDVVVATRAWRRAVRHVRPVGKIQVREKILDIGPATVELYSRVISQAKTIVWNGPMGLYEVPPFDSGSKAIARAIAHHRCRSIAGGGETLDTIRAVGAAGRFTFLSTGGGAMLEFLEGKKLPGLVAVAAR